MMGVTVRLHTSQLMGGDAEGDSWGDMTTVTYTLPDEDGEMQEHEETVPDIVNLTGSGMDDILAGDSRANAIAGGGGNDKLFGGPGGGDDTLHGGKGDDMLFGGWGSDTLHGGAGDDMLNGGKEGDTAGVDTYYGGAGSDMIYANPDDTINGWLPAFDADDPANTAPENDAETVNVDESTEDANDRMAVDTVSFARLEKAVGTTAVRWTLEANATNVENLIGTSENDFLGGDSDEPNVIEGGDGADDLTGGADNTVGTDADPDDTVSYRNSDRRVNVDLSGDTDVASGGHAQGDTIAGFENVIGSAYDDILEGDNLANKLSGLAGDDDIIGGAGSDTIEGGAGADSLDGGTNSDATTAATTTTTNGEEFSDTTVTIADTLSYAGSSAAVSVNLATHSYSGGDAEGDEIEVQRDAYDHDNDPETDSLDVSTFENLTGSANNDRLTGDHRTNTIMGGDGDDTISGGGAMDVLMGQKGDDSIKGDAGPDHLVGGPGADRLDGGEDRGERDNMRDSATDGVDNDNNGTVDDETGMVQATIDWAVYRMAEEGVEVNLSTNRGTGGEAMGDRLVGIELIWGSLHGDTIIAAADEDTFDIIHGDAGSDTVSYEASETGVVVDLSNTVHHTTATATQTAAGDPIVFIGLPDGTDPAVSLTALGVGTSTDTATNVGSAATNGAFGDRLGSIENLTGSDHNDILGGDGNPNVLKGGGGNDMLTGGDETITNAGVGDMLYGGAGRDTLSGGAGDDKLDGGAGDDDLTGGSGSDTFVFAPGHGDDVILDAIAATEKIDLSAFDLDADGLIELISIRSGRVQIDLRSVGGGTIELAANADLIALDSDGTLDDGAIDGLSVAIDANGDGDFTDTGDTNGIFIL